MWQPFTEEHEQFRKTVRAFVEKELAPHAEEWEKDELFPNELFKKRGRARHSRAPIPRGARRRRRRLLVQRGQGRGATRAGARPACRMGLLGAERHGDAGHQRHRHAASRSRSS